MHISDDIRYIGVNDHHIDLFESLYAVPDGVSYNSYVILDEKTAVLDPVDEHCTTAWMDNLRQALRGRLPDFLIVHHMEPDHSANVVSFMNAYPSATVVASAKAFEMMRGFFGQDYADHRIIVKDGDHLSLGRHRLRFFSAPMVHWPEVMISYDALEQTLFSADAFGRFGALDVPQPWNDEARRYYFGIVGKFGASVQQLLRKIAALPLQRICPLHGPVLTAPLEPYLRLYDRWSAYIPESDGVAIAYASVYGHTRRVAELLADKLRQRSVTAVLHDLARCDMAAAMADAFRYPNLVLASTTYNGDVFPPMRTFLHGLVTRNYRNRQVFLIENGSWSPASAGVMQTMLEPCSGLVFPHDTLRILSTHTPDTLHQLDALADLLAP